MENSRRSRMVKTITFWPWWQPFNSFCFETLSFSLCLSFFFSLCKKVRGGGGKTCPPTSPPFPPVVTGLALEIKQRTPHALLMLKRLLFLPFWRQKFKIMTFFIQNDSNNVCLHRISAYYVCFSHRVFFKVS